MMVDSGIESLLDFLLRSSLLLLLALLAALALRRLRAPAALGHLVWLASLVAVAALPGLGLLLPAVSLPLLPALDEAAPGQVPSFAPVTAGISGWALAYLLPALFLLARVALARWGVERIWRAAAPAPAATAEIAQLSARLGIGRNVAARLAPGNIMPMTWGTLRPRILLPAEFTAWKPARRRIVLLHELGHIARRDSLGQTAAAIICALCWMQPGIWLAARHLRLEQEHACDELVLRSGTPARSYARDLVEVAASLRGLSSPRLGVAMARPSELERRVRHIVGTTASRPSRWIMTGLATASLGATGLVAAGRLDRVVSPAAVVAPQESLPASAVSSSTSTAADVPAPRSAVRPRPSTALPMPPPSSRADAATHAADAEPASVASLPKMPSLEPVRPLQPVPSLASVLALEPAAPRAPRAAEPPA